MNGGFAPMTTFRATRDRTCVGCREVIPSGEVHLMSPGGCFYHRGCAPEHEIREERYSTAGYALKNTEASKIKRAKHLREMDRTLS